MTDKKDATDPKAPAAEKPAVEKAPKIEMHPDHPMLTKVEVEEIRKEARSKIDAQRKKSAKQQLLEIETARLAAEDGLVTGIGAQDEMVSITIDLAEYGASIVINMRPYWHAQTYTVPRHVAETLREIMQRTHMHQNEIDGKSRTHFYQQNRATELSPIKGVKNAPAAPGAEVRL